MTINAGKVFSNAAWAFRRCGTVALIDFQAAAPRIRPDALGLACRRASGQWRGLLRRSRSFCRRRRRRLSH